MVLTARGTPWRSRLFFFISDLAKTRHAKVMRRMIQAAFLGEELGDTSSLVKPEAVEEIKKAGYLSPEEVKTPRL